MFLRSQETENNILRLSASCRTVWLPNEIKVADMTAAATSRHAVLSMTWRGIEFECSIRLIFSILIAAVIRYHNDTAHYAALHCKAKVTGAQCDAVERKSVLIKLWQWTAKSNVRETNVWWRSWYLPKHAQSTELSFWLLIITVNKIIYFSCTTISTAATTMDQLSFGQFSGEEPCETNIRQQLHHIRQLL